jgi:hypothetical protein
LHNRSAAAKPDFYQAFGFDNDNKHRLSQALAS